MPTKGTKGGRKAISAEVYGEWNKKEDFKARVIPKNEEQKTRWGERVSVGSATS